MLFEMRGEPLCCNVSAMKLTITTNLDEVMTSLGQSFQEMLNPNYLLRPVAIEILPMMTERIHKEGKASDGLPIGTYSSEYMKLRTGNYGNSGKYKSGKKKGEVKDSGVFVRGDNKGQPRPKYNRSSDTKIIVSLTRQLENDWSVLETPNGYGIGFTNSFNADKLRWVEEMKEKNISDLSQKEIDYAFDRINELVADALNK